MSKSKYQINQKRNRDMFYKNRERAFKEYKKLTSDYDEMREKFKRYDIKNRLMVEYETYGEF